MVKFDIRIADAVKVFDWTSHRPTSIRHVIISDSEWSVAVGEKKIGGAVLPKIAVVAPLRGFNRGNRSSALKIEPKPRELASITRVFAFESWVIHYHVTAVLGVHIR
jgi:hypothetical protein